MDAILERDGRRRTVRDPRQVVEMLAAGWTPVDDHEPAAVEDGTETDVDEEEPDGAPADS